MISFTTAFSQATPCERFHAGFGLVRGLLVLLVLALVLELTPVAKWPAWKRSQGVAWLNAVVKEIMPWLPIEITQHPSA